jgi:hypothetical protein
MMFSRARRLSSDLATYQLRSKMTTSPAAGRWGIALGMMMIWPLRQVRHLSDASLILGARCGRPWSNGCEHPCSPPIRPSQAPRTSPSRHASRLVNEAIAVLREHHDRWRRAGELSGGGRRPSPS